MYQENLLYLWSIQNHTKFCAKTESKYKRMNLPGLAILSETREIVANLWEIPNQDALIYTNQVNGSDYNANYIKWQLLIRHQMSGVITKKSRVRRPWNQSCEPWGPGSSRARSLCSPIHKIYKSNTMRLLFRILITFECKNFLYRFEKYNMPKEWLSIFKTQWSKSTVINTKPATDTIDRRL